MKLRVVELLLITTLPALFLASKGFPSLKITLATLIGGTLAAGASNAFNMIIEVDSDKLMARTSNRPVASGEISVSNAFYFASVLTFVSLVIFSIFTNILATVLTGAAIVIYVFGYTIVLKRRTDQNIVWGGIAGCMPVLIGWAAVTNSLSITAWLFFLVIFFWTPPHFWALAIKYKDDYSAAGIPMLPVVAPMKSVRNQIWFHSVAMVLVSGATIYFSKIGWWIWIPTIILSLLFLKEVKALSGSESTKAAGRLFHWSITYLSVFSLALVIGALFLNP